MDPRLKESRKIASESGWIEIDHQENIYMVSFTNGPSRINVYYSRMTVATVVDHPKWGRNTMFRKHVDFNSLREIFKNPRAHLHTKGIPGYHMNGKHIASIKRGTTHG